MQSADFAPAAATQRTVRNTRVVLDSGQFVPLRENMTSSTKPEIHNVLHCPQKRTTPLPQATSTENLAIFGRLILWQRDTETRWLQYFAPLPWAKQNSSTGFRGRRKPSTGFDRFVIHQVTAEREGWRTVYASLLIAIRKLLFSIFKPAKGLTRGRTDHFSNIFLLWPRTCPMTLTFELDVGSVKMNQHDKYLSQRWFVICPVAIAYSMRQTINPVCLCPCVSLQALLRSHFLMDFHQNWHRRKKTKVETSSLG